MGSIVGAGVTGTMTVSLELMLSEATALDETAVEAEGEEIVEEEEMEAIEYELLAFVGSVLPVVSGIKDAPTIAQNKITRTCATLNFLSFRAN